MVVEEMRYVQVMRSGKSKKEEKRKEVLPGIEPGLLESESKVITITLQNQRVEIKDFVE